MNQDEYRREFGLPKHGSEDATNKANAALEHALDIRKFEIGLYWQRATYFWALIAAAFAGFFAILGADHLDNKEVLAFVISCVGIVFTWAWFQVNRGSKYWQENWENHVDMLEDSITGPLYKTVMHRPKDATLLEKYVTGPKAISVSKINQLVSLFTLIIWLGLLIYSVTQTSPTPLSVAMETFFGLLSGAFIYILYRCTATYEDDQEHIAKKRRTTIVGP